MDRLQLNNAKAFLYGHIELYKIQFSETGDNKYLEVMNDLHKAIESFKHLENTIERLTKKDLHINK